MPCGYLEELNRQSLRRGNELGRVRSFQYGENNADIVADETGR